MAVAVKRCDNSLSCVATIPSFVPSDISYVTSNAHFTSSSTDKLFKPSLLLSISSCDNLRKEGMSVWRTRYTRTEICMMLRGMHQIRFPMLFINMLPNPPSRTSPSLTIPGRLISRTRLSAC